MLKIKNRDLAFGIKFNAKNTNSIEHAIIFKTIKKLTETIPGFVVEGMGNVKREAEVTTSTSIGFIPGLGIFKAVEQTETPRNVICLGVSEKYNVSFEEEGSLSRSFGCGFNLPLIPVYDLSKDLPIILVKLKAYLQAEFTAKTETQNAPKVVYHSNFILVGKTRVEYGDTVTFNRLVGGRTEIETSTNPILSLIFGLK